MTGFFTHKTALTLALAGGVLAGCEGNDVPRAELPFTPTYNGIETRLLDGDLVSFIVEMEGARDNQDVADYGKCAAAQYAVIRGYGFARHVRTNVNEEGGIWRGDAVYTISNALPDGLITIDAEVVVADCKETGIPTV
ncbi:MULTISPECIES: hypothetical protein [Falsihalocynthiibacter]|uniref:hypothetical protein n=1 Tax=Falsihalocynthiibacter TaxID=2854182 RepID=UPI000A67BB70|nr:hypothetical protein [Falsihalocynthiibacter arcticus]